MDAAVDSALRDAADRSSRLLAADSGFMGGWDNGFKIRSADGNFPCLATLPVYSAARPA